MRNAPDRCVGVPRRDKTEADVTAIHLQGHDGCGATLTRVKIPRSALQPGAPLRTGGLPERPLFLKDAPALVCPRCDHGAEMIEIPLPGKANVKEPE